MHVVLISQCELRAIARTARILDAYARRQGDRTWMTPITREGLQTLHSVLRANATRQTAVACYVNQGNRQMRLLWVVGAKGKFGPKGEVAVATRHRSDRHLEPAPLPDGMRAAALLARLAGYLHDLGKFGRMFQDKLAGNGPMADAVRHEWLSLHLVLELMRINKDAALDHLPSCWDQAWATAASGRNLTRMDKISGRGSLLSSGLRNHWGALLFLIFTHHRLPGDQGEQASNTLSESTYVNDIALVNSQAKLTPVTSPALQTADLIRKTFTRLDALATPLGNDPVLWRAVATVARMGLILADHSVSSVEKIADPGHGNSLLRHSQRNQVKAAFANTARLPDGTRSMNQELNWHLQNVGKEASEFIAHFAKFDPPGLSEGVLATLRAPTTGRFSWQSTSVALLRSAQASECLPTLVFNVAGTGCGKTRMNVVIAAALRDADGSGAKVRIATALNLRTLTLQTRDAYASQLGMDDDELSCVVGCAVSSHLHDVRAHEDLEPQKSKETLVDSWGVDEDGNPDEEIFDAIGESDAPPSWLENFLRRKSKMRPVIMSPVLVCTIDHLIKAGEPSEQGNWALTNLRLMSSDLVLDEIDSYDPKALVAVMRLVTAAAFWGRHVITSSATLSSPVATAVWAAYELGTNMRSKLLALPSGTRFRVAMIDDRCPARLSIPKDVHEFHEWFRASLQNMLEAFGRATYRPAELAPVDLSGCVTDPQRKAAVLRSIQDACERLHARHRWQVIVDGNPHAISIGLVRIANINRAVEVARHLSLKLPHSRIACYHSQLPRIARFMLERSLDRILNRKNPHGGPHIEHQIREAVRQSRSQGLNETMLIVVATPVEEIGRDHDFDWAVIEPSSVQSIVQTVGRVNRHRLDNISQPNVAVLQFNFRQVQLGSSRACFVHPGLERSEEPYASHDLAQLLDWREIEQCGQIDARTRFDTTKHLFAKLDDDATQAQLRQYSRRFLKSDGPLWMGRDTYEKVPLREASPKIILSQDENGQHHREHSNGPRDTVWLRAQIKKSPRLPNDWLAWSFDQALDEAKRLGIPVFDAFAVEVIERAEDDQNMYSHSESLGYFVSK